MRTWLLFVAWPLIAQQAPTGFQVISKQNQISAEEIIKAFEAPAVEDYSFGAGDEITLEVWNHPDLSSKHVVGPDGKITVPVAGVFKIAGLTREDAQKQITAALSRYYTDVAVNLRVDRYTSFRVYVLGRVSSPGALQFEAQPRLLDVVTRAGGLPIGGVGADKAGLGRCAIIRKDQMIWINLKSLVSQGNLSLNIRLGRDDLLYMPDAGDQLVYVLGEVQHPGAFRLTPEMSFLDAFAQAGGLTNDAVGDRINVIRSVTGEHMEMRYKDLLSGPQKRNVALAEGDVIFVPKRGFAKFAYYLDKTAPIAGFAVLGSVASGR
jgi:polysaccharide export outer membrane protein